jgi:hypothetical protein
LLVIRANDIASKAVSIAVKQHSVTRCGRNGLTFGPACLFQSCFFSQLCINVGQIFPEPLVTLPAQQGVLPVVLPTSLLVVLLLGSESFFHLSSLFLSEIK